MVVKKNIWHIGVLQNCSDFFVSVFLVINKSKRIKRKFKTEKDKPKLLNLLFVRDIVMNFLLSLFGNLLLIARHDKAVLKVRSHSRGKPFFSIMIRHGKMCDLMFQIAKKFQN
jgi:hypothetical protein